MNVGIMKVMGSKCHVAKINVSVMVFTKSGYPVTFSYLYLGELVRSRTGSVDLGQTKQPQNALGNYISIRNPICVRMYNSFTYRKISKIHTISISDIL